MHKNQPDTLFKTAYSNKKGEFQFTQVDTGAYLVTASYAGYKQYQREFRIDKEMDSVLPDILLGSLINTLTTVVVTAKKPLIQQEGDKLIFNVEDDPDSKGQATIDVFRKLPFVTVDRENNIRLNGQTNFKVLLNGRETSLFARNLKEALKGFRVH